jgi:hypothetical protein
MPFLRSAENQRHGVRIVGAQPFASFDAGIQQLLKTILPVLNAAPSLDLSGKGK